MAAVRVLIVDDHAIVRDGIRALLALDKDVAVVGEAGGGREAIELSRRLAPDVIVMDIAMPDLGGLEATLEIRKDRPDAKIVVLSQYGDASYVRRFLKAGVSGYVLKKAAGADLVAAIHSVARGGLVLDPDVARDALDGDASDWRSQGARGWRRIRTAHRSREAGPQARRRGAQNKEVAALLNQCQHGRCRHREHVMEKLRAHNRTDLIRFALRHGVIRADP